jgi:hypothetical protein
MAGACRPAGKGRRDFGHLSGYDYTALKYDSV